MRRRRRGIAALLSAGILFQGTQCALDTSELLPDLLTSIASVLISSWVNDQLGVTPTGF
jgi:hypothetical protein